MRTLMTFVLVLGALLLAGCKGPVLMATPAAVSEGGINPFEKVVPERQNSRVPVFVASARTVSGKEGPLDFYTTDRSREVRLGLATLSIGSGMTWEQLVAESCVKKRSKDPEVLVVSYEEFGPLWTTAWPPNIRFDRDWDAEGLDREPANRFVEAIDAELSRSRRRQITVYVHGFNTTFGGNLTIAGEFWHYMARDEVLISFDWPSKGSLFSYEDDKANSYFAIRQLRKLLEFLASETTASRINILAHSAGNPIAIEALRQLSLIHYDLDGDEARQRTKIGHVVFAAPDADLDTTFSAAVDGAGRVADGFAIYASKRDKALGFSGNIFGDVRLGRSIGKLSEDEKAAIIANDSQWIDATNAQRKAPSFLGHSYYHQNPWISSDVMLFLRTGCTAQERGLVRNTTTGFMEFPDDYAERLPEIVEQLKAKYETHFAE